MKARHFSKLSVHHSDKLDNQYEVAEKDFPADLMAKHTHYNGRRIRWLANFGYRHKATGAAVAGRLEERPTAGNEPRFRPAA